jgi:hypothetical protein
MSKLGDGRTGWDGFEPSVTAFAGRCCVQVEPPVQMGAVGFEPTRSLTPQRFLRPPPYRVEPRARFEPYGVGKCCPPDSAFQAPKFTVSLQPHNGGVGENRTPVTGFGDQSSTTELRPLVSNAGHRI